MPKHVPGAFSGHNVKPIKFTVEREQYNTGEVFIRLSLKYHNIYLNIEGNGYIAGYRNSDIERGLSKYMLPKAIELGATWLRCYDSKVKLYEAFGFHVIDPDYFGTVKMGLTKPVNRR